MNSSIDICRLNLATELGVATRISLKNTMKTTLQALEVYSFPIMGEKEIAETEKRQSYLLALMKRYRKEDGHGDCG